ncbi:o-fucosyltransferase 16 [Quercus suber]|uniref:O-fucosyltransferase 16 n=1 Tax=Quercus suber TaxID=58331 RepID=A0AAW0LFD5_QUESU
MFTSHTFSDRICKWASANLLPLSQIGSVVDSVVCSLSPSLSDQWLGFVLWRSAVRWWWVWYGYFAWMKSDCDIWTSKNSKFYHGCNNASNKFPKVEAITHPNLYLVIATSGGLNQQRTGMAKGRVVCLYGGEDINWIWKFTTTVKAVAEAAGIKLELVYVGKNKDGQYYLEDQMKWLGPINKVCCENLV